MPVLAGHVFGGLARLDHQPLGVAAALGLQGVHVQPPEPAGEAFVVLGGQVLVAENDDVVLQQRTVDLRELLVRQLGRQVHPFDLGPDHRRQRTDVDSLVRLAFGGHQRFDGFQGLAVQGVSSGMAVCRTATPGP